MVLSRSTEYAIRALTFLAQLPPGQLAGAREISEAEGIPIPYLWKILQTLARRKLIRSFKGIHGGYELALPPAQVPLHSIVMATDGVDFSGQCVLGLPECSDVQPCPLHETWKDVRSRLVAMFEQTTLADLARVAKSRKRSKAS